MLSSSYCKLFHMLVVQQIHYILQFTRIWTSNSSVPAFIALLLSLLTSVTAVDWKITLSDVCLLCRLKARSLSPSPSLSFFLPPPSYRPNLAHLALFYGRRHIWIDVCCPWKHCKNGGRGEETAGTWAGQVATVSRPFHAILTRLCQSPVWRH